MLPDESNENGRLARIETKLDIVIENNAKLTERSDNPMTGCIAHEQRLQVVEGRTKTILEVCVAVLVIIIGVVVKMILFH